MRRIIIWSLGIFMGLVSGDGVYVFAQVQEESRPMKGELTEKELNALNRLENELSDLGLRFECWFTIERTGGAKPRTLEAARFRIDDEVKSLEALEKAIESQLKAAEVKVDPRHPRVLHVIERSLTKDKNYGMDRSATLKYSGVLADLPASVGKVIPGIDMRRGGSNLDAYNDHVTQVEIDAKEKPVRDILTDAVPIDDYSPVLWVAETFEREGKQVTWVQFTGPRSPEEPEQ